ncbi:MAG: hypothetical protein UT69_C0012G0036, partial [Candidatus Yanofskybacteria bacterium GW2011_GWE1_40_10]
MIVLPSTCCFGLMLFQSPILGLSAEISKMNRATLDYFLKRKDPPEVSGGDMAGRVAGGGSLRVGDDEQIRRDRFAGDGGQSGSAGPLAGD